MNLIDIIRALHNTPGNNDKLAILAANKDNELLKAYMKAVMDPAINYYITKVPKVSPGNLATLDAEFIDWLTANLSTRKLSGKAAAAALKATIAAMDAEGQELVGYIIKRKLGTSKVGDTMVLKTWPGLFFIPPYMRCAGMDAKTIAHYRTKRRFYVQPKRDGSFAYLTVGRDVGYNAITRTGNYYPTWFAQRLAKGVPDGFNIVLIGEMEVYEGATLLDRKTGNGILNSVASGEDDREFSQYTFKYVAWDVLQHEEFKTGKSDWAYQNRLLKLDELLCKGKPEFIEQIETHEVESVEEAFEIHTALTTVGKEGTVWKTMDGGWRDTSSGTKDAVKLKVKFRADYEILDTYEGEGKAAGMLGGFTVATLDRLLITNVGSGFSDADRIHLWKIRHELPGTITELEANDVITNRNRPDIMALSLPIFIELRTDKKEADTLERVIEQRDAARIGGNK